MPDENTIYSTKLIRNFFLSEKNCEKEITIWEIILESFQIAQFFYFICLENSINDNNLI